jgi:ABC transporter substrate binding protein
MRRRNFLRLMGVVAIMPHSASAQSGKQTYRVGLFNRGAPITDTSGYGKGLIRGLEKRGYVLGRNLEFERRGAGGRFDILPNLLAELVASKVDVIVAFGYPAAFAAKTRSTLPVVVHSTGDPVGTGLVDSLVRPSGNVTGISDMAIELSPKRLQLLKELVPTLRRVGIIWNTFQSHQHQLGWAAIAQPRHAARIHQRHNDQDRIESGSAPRSGSLPKGAEGYRTATERTRIKKARRVPSLELHPGTADKVTLRPSSASGTRQTYPMSARRSATGG